MSWIKEKKREKIKRYLPPTVRHWYTQVYTNKYFDIDIDCTERSVVGSVIISYSTVVENSWCFTYYGILNRPSRQLYQEVCLMKAWNLDRNNSRHSRLVDKAQIWIFIFQDIRKSRDWNVYIKHCNWLISLII